MRASRSLASEIAPLIGTPWQAGGTGPDAYDCWAAAAMVQSRLFGRSMPRLAPVRRRGIAAARQAWAISDHPSDGDIVEMRRMGRANHVGVWIDGGILHCQRGAGMVYDRPSDIRNMGWRMRFWTPSSRPRATRTARICPAVYVPGLDLMLDPDATPEAMIAAHRAVPVFARVGDSISEVVAAAGLGGDAIAAFLRPMGGDAPIGREVVDDAALAILLRNLGAVPVEEWAARRIAPGECLVLTQLPQGGGGSNPLATILSIAVMAAAFFVAGPLGLGATLSSAFGVSATLGTTLAFGAVSALGQFVVSTLLPPPSPRGVSGLSDDVSPTFSSSAQSSIARPGAPIPVQFGRHIHQLDDVAPPFSRFVDNKQVICQLLALGAGEHVLEEVRLGDTAVWRDGALTGTIPGVAIEHVPAGSAVSLFEEAVWTQSDVTGLTLEPDSVVGWHTAVPRGHKADAIELDIAFQQLVTIDSGGNDLDRTVEIRVEAQLVDDDDIAFGDVIELQTLSFTAATRSALRSSHKWFVIPGRWRVRLTRLTPEGDNQTFDTALWAGLKGILPGGRILDDIELLAVRVEVGEQFAAQSARRVQAVKTRKLPVWDGTAWTAPQPTRAIAWAVAEVARAHQRLDDLDIDELLALHTTWEARGDHFDTVFDQNISFWEALQAVLRVGRAQADQIGRRIRLWRDEPRPVPRQLFSERNIRRGSLVVRPRLPVSDRPERLVAQYMDEGTWRPAEITVGAISGRERRERYFGITDREHLIREVSQDFRAAKFRSVEVSFDVELENRLLLRGDPIAVSHFELTNGFSVALEAWSGLDIRLGRALDLAGFPDEMLLIISAEDASVVGPFRVTMQPADRVSSLAVAEAEMARVIADHGSDPREWISRNLARDEPIRAVLGVGTEMTMRLLVQSVGQERQGYATLTCIDDDQRAHDFAVAAQGGLDDVILDVRVQVFAVPGGHELQIRVDLASTGKSLSILYEYSTDGSIWLPLGEGPPTYSATRPTGMTHLRAAAIEGSVRGPWFVVTLAQVSLASPAPIAETSPGSFAAQGDLGVSGAAVAGATSYRFEIVGAGDALLAIQFRADPALNLGRAALVSLGALSREMVVRVAAMDASGKRGPAAALDLSVPAPALVTGFVQLSNGLLVWDVPEPAPTNGWRVRWQQFQGAGATGEAIVHVAEWSRAGAGWPNLVWVAAVDGIGPGPEEHLDFTPPDLGQEK